MAHKVWLWKFHGIVPPYCAAALTFGTSLSDIFLFLQSFAKIFTTKESRIDFYAVKVVVVAQRAGAMVGKIGASVCALAMFFANLDSAMASSQCARNDEVTAIQVTSIQQQLMVAALTCGQVVNYNAFQTSYSSELRTSDATLMHMFQRFYGARGDSEYHAFKTRVANDSELRSIHDNPTYCAVAQTVFASALTPSKPTLANFVSGVPVMESSPFNSCEVNVANRFPSANNVASASQQTESGDTRSLIWQREYGAPVAVAGTPPGQ